MIDIDTQAMTDFLVELLAIPSPTGFHEDAIAFCQTAFSAFPISISKTNKGALLATWEGDSVSAPRALTAHVDTLGALVEKIKANGRLKLSMLGGFAWGSIEG